MSKLLQYMRDNNSPADNYYENQGQEEEQQESSSGSFFDGAKKWLGEYIDAVSEGRPMWKSEATIKPVDWGTAGGNGSMPTTFSISTYENMQNPETTLGDVGNAIADRISEITPDALKPQVIAPNWQPRPLNDSVYSDTPGTPTADGKFGEIEDENEREKRMNEAAQWAADNMPRSYSAMLGAVSGAANVAGGIRNALGGENSDWILRNAEKSDEAMNKFRQQWENQYGDSGYILNPNGLANDIGNGIGSSVPIMSLSLLAPEAAVGVGTRAITSALTRAGLGRLATSKAGQALIEEVVRSPLSTAGDTMAEYGTVVDDLVQGGMSEDEAREQAKGIIPRNVALDTLTIPGELYVMKGAKGLGRKFQAASTDSIGKRIEKGMARAGLMSAANAIPEGYQEGAQNALEDNVKGERNTSWYNPFSWNDDDLQAARAGAVGGAIMGIPGNVAKGMQTYSNTGNAGIDAAVDAANEYNIDPKALLSIGARESGGDDITAIGSASQNAFQIEDETAENYGVDKMYPDWKTDLKQNAEAAAFILTKKIEENGGDVWAGVAGYNGGGDPDYLAKVQNTYNSIPDDYVSGGGSGIQPYNLPTQGADIDEQVSNLTPEFQSALPTIGGILNEMGLADGAAISSAARTPEHNAEVGGAENSYHVHNDAVDIVLPEGTTQEQADAVAERFRNTGAFKEVLFHDAGSGYHLHLGGYNGGLNGRGGAGGTVESTYKGDGGAAYMEEQREADRQYQQEQRDRDNAYQQEINNIMNDNTSETIANDVDKEMKDAKAQQEESMKALTPEQQKEEISDYLDSVSQDDISDEDFNALWDATQSNDQKQIQTAYQTVQDAKKAQTAKPIKTEDTPVLKSVQKQKQPTQQGTISTENTSANQTEPNTQTVQDNKQTQPLEQTVQPPLNTAPNGNPIHTQQGAMNNETTQSTQSTNNQNVNTKSEQNQRENAETVQAQKGTENQGTTGIIENVRTDNAKQNIPAQYKLVSADDVISSDMPAYPQQYQPRNRNRLGMVAQVEDMSNQLNPSAVVDQTGNVNMGAPVINSKGVVLNGNGRTMAIRKAYSKDNKSAQAYKQYLKDNAEKLGLDPTVVDKIKNPMIVRQVADDAPIEDIIHSTAGGSRMSASEQAKSDAKKIRTSTLDKYKKENSPDLSALSNRAFVKSILDDITTDTDRDAMYTESGQITKEAIRRVQDALFARAYGDDSLLNRMTESTDDNIRIVSKVMLQCAPKVAKLKEGQEHGDFYSEYDVSNVITQAAKDLIEARDAGKPISYKLRENDMFETSKRKDDEAIKITLKFFDDNKRKPRRIQEYVNSLADYVIGMGNPKFEMESNPLFDGGGRMTMDELANFTEEEINGGRNSNLYVEGERTNTETKSVHQTVQEESGATGSGSIQKSNETKVKENTASKEANKPKQAQETKATESQEDHKTESEPERTSPDEIDLRTISIEDAERQAMEALGIKPHKKPVLPKPTKGTPKPRKRTPIKDDETIDFHIHIVDDSDEALARALKVFNEEASKLNANPMFNPRLMTAAMEIGAIHAQRGANKFIDCLKAMGSTDSRLKSYAPAVWKALQVFPKNGTLNEKQMTSLIQFVGVMYHHGITDKIDLRKRFIAALGVKNAKYFDTAYTAIVEYPTAEELKGIDAKEEPAPKEENVVDETLNNENNKDVDKNVESVAKGENNDGQQEKSKGLGGGHTGNEPAKVGRTEKTGESAGTVGKDTGLKRQEEGKNPSTDNRGQTGGMERQSDKKDADRPRSGNDSTGNGTRGNKQPVLTPAQKKNAKPSEVAGHNYHIDLKASDESGSVREKITQNIAAIKLLKQLEAEGRRATPAEQDVLAKYSGWGTIADAFTDKYGKENAELKEILTEEEYKSAKKASTTAFYTDPKIVNKIWEAVEKLGFKGGRVLDPSMGTGVFFGCMPENIASKSSLTGIEIDNLTGRIAQQLYQKSNIQITGFEKMKGLNNYFDLAISNIPFENIRVHDIEFDKYNYQIHNYFFAKAMSKVRPGGLVAFITGQGTMQSKKDAEVLRVELSKNADLIAAIKLPNTAFKGNAKTDVTTDVLILQKREIPAKKSKYAQSWDKIQSVRVQAGRWMEPTPLNEYYVKNKDNMLGNPIVARTQYRETKFVLDGKGVNLEERFEKLIEKLPNDVYQPRKNKQGDTLKATKTAIADSKMRDGAFIMKDGVPMQNDNGVLKEIKESKANKGRVESYIRLRNIMQELIAAEIDPNSTKEKLDVLRKNLNRFYDEFVKKYGYLNERKNHNSFVSDSSYGTVEALERCEYTKDKGKAAKISKVGKADIFKERTIEAIKDINHADTASDALTASLNNKGTVDIDYMVQLTGRDKTDIIQELRDSIYKNPVSGNYETSEEYLSGNVLEKLEYAEEAAKTNPAYNENVKALQKVQPVKLQPQEIYASLGASWIPQSDVEDYANSLIDSDDAVKVLYHPALGTWEVQTTGFTEPVSEYQTKRRSFVEILDAALNNKDIKITHTEDKKQVQSKEDIEETTLANQKLEDIRNNFSKWLWEDDERAERLSDYYNRTFNNTALRQYSGSHLNFKGMNAAIKLRDYQKNAIWRIMQDKNTLLAHCVGAGKTFTMQAAAMEMKRLGICQKPLFAVPKNVVNQFAKEFRILYPNANILIIDSDTLPAVPNSTPKKVINKETGEVTTKELTAKEKEKINNQRVKRVRALSRIKTEDWDAIIISHTTLNRLAMAPEAYQAFYQEQIEQLEFAEREITAMENKDVNSKRFLKDLEKKKQNLQAKMEKAMSVEKKDVGITFEDLGIDQIFVDEADKFKNLAFATKLGRISGISSNGSQSAMDMFIKTQYLTKLNNGRGVVFATGTPISNTMNEMYTMMRYLNMDALKNTGNAYFDSWVSTFGQIVTKQERDPSGVGWRNTKAVKFANTPEMVRQFREVADVKRPEDIKIKRPKIKGGKPTVIAVEPTEALKIYIKKDIADRVKAIRSGKGFGQKGADNMLAVTNSLRQASLDMRLINPTLGEEEGGKVRALADQVTQVYKDTEKEKGAQIIFCDLSTPKGTSDKVDEKTTDDDNSKESQDMYARIMKALLQKGIPKNQIAFVHDAKNDEEKQQLFEKVDSGELRVLIGSTEKMGAGTNFQHHLAALHHFTCPWRPRDLEQREGRILRYGNMFDEVQIFEYVTKDSYDANMWEKVKNKAMTIAQAMSGDLTTRIVDDADNGAITYAEAEALATGNPLMREKTEVDTEVMRYKGMLSGHLREVSNAQREIKIHAPEIPNNKAKIERIKKDIAQRQDLSGDKFKAIIDGKTYTERKNADNALLTAVKDLKNNTVEEIGSIGGFAIKARKEVDYSSDKGVHYITKITLVKNFSYEAGPSIKSIESTLNSKPETTLKDTEKETEKLNSSIKAWEKTAGAKFKYQDKLDELLKRQKEINDEFNKIENSTNENTEDTEESTSVKTETTKYSARGNSEEIQRSMQEVKDEIKNALPTAKDVTEDGNTLTFTMPNGSKIAVDVQNQITLTEEQLSQAKKDHNIDGNVVVEGYAQKYGKDAYIALSQGSRKGTGYHEVYHVAEDAVLNDKEKAALRKKYPNEEIRADKCAEWVEARKHGKGTLFGKLFRKIQDFAKKMQAILTRTENVHNVFRKIESGEVWNRKASESNLSKYNLGIIAKERLEEDKKSWNKVVNDFTRGEIKKDVPYKIMHTPLVLQMIGAKDAPFMVDGAKIYHLMEHDESISPSILKELPNKIADPIMVINSYAGRKVALLDLKGKNKASVIAIVELNKKRNRYDVSLLNNMYSKNNAIKSQTGTWIQKEGTNFEWFYKNIKDGNVIYKNNKKSTQWIQSEGSYSPNQGNALDALSKLSIPNETDLDNLRKANPTKYSIRKTQDKTPLNPKEREQEQRKEDILKAINEIVPVYTKSDVKKNAVTETYYDRRQKVGFVKTPTIREYGRILALNLDQQLKLKNNMELTTNVKQELEKNQSYAALMGDKIKDMTPVQARAEGVSIFGSLYFNGNEEAAAARFPKYYEAFKNALKENKELNDKVNHITEMIGDYKAQDPVLRANSGMQMHDESKKKTTKGKINAILDKVYAEMVDELDPLTKITKLAEKEAQQKLLYKYDVHKQALMAQGNAQSKANLLLNSGKDKEEAINALNDKDMFNGAIQYKVNMNDIMDAIKNVPQEELEKIGVDDARQGLAKYLIAMRTNELSKALDNDYVRPDGFDEEACYNIIKNVPESIKTAAKMVWDFNKNMINIMQQQGLINKKAADTMRKYTYYVPMYHDMSDMQDIDDFIGAVGKGGRGFVDIKPNIYEIKGGNERAIIDPIESMVRMTVTLLNKCQRNKVGQTLARINQDFEGMGSIIAKDPTLKHEDPKKCAFSVYIGGKKVIYRTTPEVYSILTDVDENGASVLESILKPFASALRRGATISPPFIVRNLTRDTVTAGITSQTGFIPFVDSFRGMYKLTTDKQFKMDYLASGASMGTFIRSDVHGAKDLLSEITGDKYSSWPKGLKQIAQFISAVWNHYDKFANLVEDGTRAGEFMRARKKGISLEEAGYLAKEVTLNFGRHGKAGKHINRAVPFFNATIQGADKFIRAFKKNPARASFMTAVTIILPSIMAWALANGSDDDWYQDLDANTKYTNWCFKIGDAHILIPKPQEAGILFGSGVEAVLNQMMGKDPQAMKQWARQYAETLIPNIFPTLIAPIVEWQTNYSFWKGRALVGKSLQNLPSEYQYNTYTSEIAKALGGTWLAKSLDISPIAIDNAISGYFGSAGRFIANMLNSPVDYLRDSSRPAEPAKYWYQMPFIGSFVRKNHENSEYQNRFYDLVSDMTDDYNRMKHDNPKAKPPKGYKEMETAKKTVSKLNKEIQGIKSDTKMGPEQKLQQIELRQNKIRHFTKKFVTQYGR